MEGAAVPGERARSPQEGEGSTKAMAPGFPGSREKTVSCPSSWLCCGALSRPSGPGNGRSSPEDGEQCSALSSLAEGEEVLPQ